ncbi:MAG: type II secretion system F family protein, partial [Hyphomicrobiaceae bacterium]
MALFKYTAVTPEGERVAGELEASSRHAVLGDIETLGYMPVHVEEAADVPGRASRWFLSSGRRMPSPAQITHLTRELAMLLAAGLPLSDTLRHIVRNTRRPAIAALVDRVSNRLNDGQTLGAALEAEGAIFPSSYCSMVRVAEESGTLPLVLERIAQAREQTEKLHARVRSALIYPAFLVVTGIGAVLVMLLAVVPRFKQLLATVEGAGTGAMSRMIDVSEWMIAYKAHLLVGVALLIVTLLVITRQSWFRAAVSGLAQKIPYLRDVLRTRHSGVFCRTLGT